MSNKVPALTVFLWIVCATLLFTPLIISYSEESVRSLQSAAIGSWSTHFDIFRLRKAQFIWTVGVLSFAAIMIYKREYLKYVILSAAPVVASSLISAHQEIVWRGFPGQYMGALTIVSLFFFAMCAHLIKSEAARLKAFYFAFASGSIISFLAILEVNDIMFDEILRFFLNSQSDVISIKRSKGWVATTLFNSNYLGVFTCLLATSALSLYALKQSYWLLLPYSVFIVAMLLSASKAALLTSVVVGTGFMAFFVYFKLWRQLLAVLLVTIVVLSFFRHSSDSKATRTIDQQLKVIKKNSDYLHRPPDLTAKLKGIEANKSKIMVIYGEHQITLNHQDFTWTFTSPFEEVSHDYFFGSPIKMKLARFPITLKISSFNGLPSIEVAIDGNGSLQFVKTLVGFRAYVNQALVKLQPKVKYSLPFSGEFLSRRGFIWNSLLSTMPGSMLFGHGPDAFTLVFPQNDFVSKMNFYGRADIWVDKPHSFYLQILHGMGLVGLLGYLLWLSYIFHSACLDRNRLSVSRKVALVSILVWMSLSLTNDATVGTSPFIAMLFGFSKSKN